MLAVVQFLITLLFSFVLSSANKSEPVKTFSDERDGNTFEYSAINYLNWMQEYLRFKLQVP